MKVTDKRQQELKQLEQVLGIEFEDISLLHQALTHTSYANENKNLREHNAHNERLEFLGDAVLELAVSTYLYKRFPRVPEGWLTKARASTVCEASLSKRANELGFGDFLLLGHGEAASGGAHRPSILEDAFESVIGAVYLDQGWEVAKDYVLTQLKDALDNVKEGPQSRDYKTILQEKVQKKNNQLMPIYELVGTAGPDHAKTFSVVVKIGGEVAGHGRSFSKKSAEQMSAHEALQKLKQQSAK